MSELRVLLFARRYWPCCDDSVQRISLFAESLRRRGLSVTVLTPRYASGSPERFLHREIPVERPFDYPRSLWAFSRYSKFLGKWLEKNAQQFDLLYVDSMREEASILVQTANRLSLPTIVRCGGGGSSSDIQWWQHARGANRSMRTTLSANAFIAPRPAVMQQLLASGVPAEKIVRINDGLPPAKRTTTKERQQARSALACVCHDLRLDDDSKVILTPAKVSGAQQIADFLDSLGSLLNQWPSVRIWTIVSSADRARLELEIRRRSMVGDVVPLGSFDHYEEVVDAADLVVATSSGDCWEAIMPYAVARGIPVLLAQCNELRSLFGGESELANWFNPEQHEEFPLALHQLLTFDESAARNAEQLRIRLSVKWAIQQSTEEYFKLFSQLAAPPLSGAGLVNASGVGATP